MVGRAWSFHLTVIKTDTHWQFFFFMIIWYHRNVVIREKCCQRIRMADGKNLFFFFGEEVITKGQNTGVGSCSLLQVVFPTQGSNLGLPHCRHILFQLSHKGSPRILKWVVYPFSSGSSQPRSRTRVCCIAGGFCNNWAMRKVNVRWSRSVVPDSLRPHE